jgi:hypothetical protein
MIRELHIVEIGCDEPGCTTTVRFRNPDEAPCSSLFAVECMDYLREQDWNIRGGRAACPKHLPPKHPMFNCAGKIRMPAAKRKGEFRGEVIANEDAPTGGPGADSGVCLFEL